jgi:hypothetical protein
MTMKRGFLLNTNHDEHILQLRGRGSSRSHPFPSQDRVGLQFSRGPSPWSSLSVVRHHQGELPLQSEGNKRLSQVQTKSKGTAERTILQTPWAIFRDAEDMDMEMEETKTNRNEPTSYPNSPSVIAPAYVIPARRQNSSSSNISLKSSSLIPESISLLPPPPPPPLSTSSVPQSFGSSSVPSTLPSTIQSTATTTITVELSKHLTTTQQQQQVAFLPTKTVDVPKAALSGWYGQRPRTHQLSKSQFVSWDDSGPPHRRRFTSLFVCPLTGEIFASGRFGGMDQPPTYHITKDLQSGCDVVWYSKFHYSIVMKMLFNDFFTHSFLIYLLFSLLLPFFSMKRQKNYCRTCCCSTCL